MEYRVIQTWITNPYHGNLLDVVESMKRLTQIFIDAGAQSARVLRIDAGTFAGCVGLEVTYRNGHEFGQIWYGGIDTNQKWRAFWDEAWGDEELGEFMDHQISWEVI
jgi:hypothetical protein